MSGGDWCLIESDPGVFTELIKEFGVKGAQVEELFSLDEENFTNLQPIHGLIFLFKWSPDVEQSGRVVIDGSADHVFFAKQVINNACASQAIINLLCNIDHSDVKLGDTLSDLKQFTSSFDAASRGLTISNSETIRASHNSFARQQLFEMDQKAAPKDDDVFHFTCYLPVSGRLYELDGLQEGPIDHGPIPNNEDWLSRARPVIDARMRKYSTGEIHFNLMAVISDVIDKSNRQIEALQKVYSGDGESEEISDLKQIIQLEEQKRKKFKIENIRRRHNYIPFIVELMRILASRGKLVDLVSQAKEKSDERQKSKKRKIATD